MTAKDKAMIFDTFIRGCKADGIWDLILDCAFFVGLPNLNSILVKLKTPTGVSRTLVNTNFVTADYTATGASAGLRKLTNTNAYLNTGVAAQSHFTIADFGYSRYVTAPRNNSSIQYDGARSLSPTTTTEAATPLTNTSIDAAIGSTTSRATFNSWTGVGMVSASRLSASDLRLVVNGTLAATNTSTESVATLPTTPHFIFAWNNNGSANFFSAEKRGFHALHRALTASEELALSNRVNAVMAAFGCAQYYSPNLEQQLDLDPDVAAWAELVEGAGG